MEERQAPKQRPVAHRNVERVAEDPSTESMIEDEEIEWFDLHCRPGISPELNLAAIATRKALFEEAERERGRTPEQRQPEAKP